jgi:hypothetical protein
MAILGAFAIGIIATIDPFEQLKKGKDTSINSTSNELYTAFVRSVGTNPQGILRKDYVGIPLDSAEGKSLVKTLIDYGELKTNFTTISKSVSDHIYFTGNQDSSFFTLCFAPESKSYKTNRDAHYDKFGYVTDCTKNTCYICTSENPSPQLASNGIGYSESLTGPGTEALPTPTQSSPTPTQRPIATLTPIPTVTPTPIYRGYVPYPPTILGVKPVDVTYAGYSPYYIEVTLSDTKNAYNVNTFMYEILITGPDGQEKLGGLVSPLVPPQNIANFTYNTGSYLPNTTYTVSARAIGDYGAKSIRSNSVTVTTLAGPDPKPQAPVITSILPYSSAQSVCQMIVTIADDINKLSDINSYEFYINSETTPIATMKVGSLSVLPHLISYAQSVFGRFTSNTTYAVTVVAVGNNGYRSEPSNTYTIKTTTSCIPWNTPTPANH